MDIVLLINTISENYAALALIGGFGWATLIAEKIVSIINRAIEKGKVGGCDMQYHTAKRSFLNNVRHTGNGLEQHKL